MAKFNPIQITVAVSVSDGPDAIRRTLTALKEFEAEPRPADLVRMMELERTVAGAYRERNQLVAVLTKIWPSYWSRDDDADPGWQHVIFIDGPTGQLSWHVSDDDFISSFEHLANRPNQWDGHTTAEKYQRLAAIGGDQ